MFEDGGLMRKEGSRARWESGMGARLDASWDLGHLVERRAGARSRMRSLGFRCCGWKRRKWGCCGVDGRRIIQDRTRKRKDAGIFLALREMNAVITACKGGRSWGESW